jgi:hypothetical protein
MRKSLLLLAASVALVAAGASATLAQKATKGGPEFVGDALSQIFVPVQSTMTQPAAAPAKGTTARKAKRSKKKSARKAKRSSKKAKRSRAKKS